MSKIALTECVKMPKIALIECDKILKIALFECYCWQNLTTISNTDLYLSYFDLSYIFPGHNDSVERGLTVKAYCPNI